MRPELLRLLGVPFKRGGRCLRGLDCLGLCLAGLEILRPELELEDPWETLRARWASGWRPEHGESFPPGWTELELSAELKAGDVLTMRGDGGTGGMPLAHLALAIDRGNVLHTTHRTGVVIVRRELLEGRLESIMRPPAPQGARL